jgi:hypothetical protein
MHSEYLRGIFLENRITAGRFAVEGRVIALKDISAPLFVIGTETDHIAPWQSVYKTALFTDCDLHFLLTKGGHNSGILSEPGHKGRHYRIGHRPAGALYRDPDTLVAGMDKLAGQPSQRCGARAPARHTSGLSRSGNGTGDIYPSALHFTHTQRLAADVPGPHLQ